MSPWVAILIAYVSGSIPFAYIVARLVGGIDLRAYGSGNLGATNVYRALGFPAAFAVFLLDAAKGALPVLLLPAHGARGGWWSVAYGVAAILGHVRPVFFLWRRGGKGVATAAGVFLALTLLPAVISTGLWVIVLTVTRYVSVASLAAATALPIAQLLLRGPHPVFWMAVVTAAFVWLTHRANIARLRRGKEPKTWGRRKGKEPKPRRDSMPIAGPSGAQ
jgi:acyl phosphate:glycerol-3-phosphate acyltransferase